ncbi:MAG: hypothetical protein ABIR77_02750 [Sphingomicrobium sp.]
MPKCGTFRDLLARLDLVPAGAAIRSVPVSLPAPYLKDLAERQWIVDGIVRFACTPLAVPATSDESSNDPLRPALFTYQAKEIGNG